MLRGEIRREIGKTCLVGSSLLCYTLDVALLLSIADVV